MKQAPLRALRCLPRERMGMWSGVRAIVSLPSGKGRARRSRATSLLVCAGIRFGTTPTWRQRRNTLGGMNPRYRRLVIPCALGGLILIAVIAALVRVSEPLLRALARMRGLLLDEQVLVRAVASGRQKGERPRWRRAELRYVDLKAGRQLQVVTYDETQAFTANHAPGAPARDAVDALLDEPFGNWHVDTTTETHQLRVTKKLEAVVHTAAPHGSPRRPPTAATTAPSPGCFPRTTRCSARSASPTRPDV